MQWDSVSRKKDKKPPSNQPSKDSAPHRGESRGARGGRGGRGGPGRGGATARGRGAHRGSAVNGHAGRTASPRPAADASPSVSVASTQPDLTEAIKSSSTDANGQQNGVTQTANAWADSKHPQPEASNATSISKQVETDVTTTPSPVPVNVSVAAPKQALKAPSFAPGPAKLSWAQIARYFFFHLRFSPTLRLF